MLEPTAWTVENLITDFSRDFSAYQTKTYAVPLYSAKEIRKWLMEEPSAAMIHRAVESYDSNDGSMVEYCRGLFAAKLEELK